MLFNQFEECLKEFRKCRELQGNNDPVSTFHISHIEFRLRAAQNPTDPRLLTELEEKIAPLQLSEAFVLLGQVRGPNINQSINQPPDRNINLIFL